jgi:hypothetical protein
MANLNPKHPPTTGGPKGGTPTPISPKHPPMPHHNRPNEGKTKDFKGC